MLRPTTEEVSHFLLCSEFLATHPGKARELAMNATAGAMSPDLEVLSPAVSVRPRRRRGHRISVGVTVTVVHRH